MEIQLSVNSVTMEYLTPPPSVQNLSRLLAEKLATPDVDPGGLIAAQIPLYQRSATDFYSFLSQRKVKTVAEASEMAAKIWPDFVSSSPNQENQHGTVVLERCFWMFVRSVDWAKVMKFNMGLSKGRTTLLLSVDQSKACETKPIVVVNIGSVGQNAVGVVLCGCHRSIAIGSLPQTEFKSTRSPREALSFACVFLPNGKKQTEYVEMATNDNMGKSTPIAFKDGIKNAIESLSGQITYQKHSPNFTAAHQQTINAVPYVNNMNWRGVSPKKTFFKFVVFFNDLGSRAASFDSLLSQFKPGQDLGKYDQFASLLIRAKAVPQFCAAAFRSILSHQNVSTIIAEVETNQVLEWNLLASSCEKSPLDPSVVESFWDRIFHAHQMRHEGQSVAFRKDLLTLRLQSRYPSQATLIEASVAEVDNKKIGFETPKTHKVFEELLAPIEDSIAALCDAAEFEKHIDSLGCLADIGKRLRQELLAAVSGETQDKWSDIIQKRVLAQAREDMTDILEHKYAGDGILRSVTERILNGEADESLTANGVAITSEKFIDGLKEKDRKRTRDEKGLKPPAPKRACIMGSLVVSVGAGNAFIQTKDGNLWIQASSEPVPIDLDEIAQSGTVASVSDTTPRFLTNPPLVLHNSKTFVLVPSPPKCTFEPSPQCAAAETD